MGRLAFLRSKSRGAFQELRRPTNSCERRCAVIRTSVHPPRVAGNKAGQPEPVTTLLTLPMRKAAKDFDIDVLLATINAPTRPAPSPL